MRKYKFLNKENANKRDVAYNAKGIADKYVFQRSSIDINYLVCDTIEEFYAYYSTRNPSSRMHFEVIDDSFSPQKLKIDIDGRIGDNEMAYVLKEDIRRLVRSLQQIQSWKHTLVGLDAEFAAIAESPATYSGLSFIDENDSDPALSTRLGKRGPESVPVSQDTPSGESESKKSKHQ
ncbi:hypothetical protein EDD11_000265 [Mortierella claussenii]|nr:hypothetical protein EDD11_000265 [Mortierella claussenii]